ncbi:glycosyltransferase [Crocinitomicaceae bacterium]|nr:glycosyltransferase [Crocinitomicaceae bacterium]
MILTVLLYLSIYSLSFFILVRWGGMYQTRKEISYSSQHSHIECAEITVLIPFRNEASRLDGLIESINKLSRIPSNFIFINDHSEDESVHVIEEKLKIKNYKILDLPPEFFGKKRALRYGAEQVTTEYILTFDADVEFDSQFFDKMESLGKADMYVLQAIMKSKKWYECFYEIDVLLVSAVNFGISGFFRPVVASGANLLYKTAVFNRVDNLDAHVHVSSGDDVYLLRDFRASKCEVRLHTSLDHSVVTETPRSFKEFIAQRIRWIGKTTDIKDAQSAYLVIFQTLLTFVFFGLLVWTLIENDWVLALKLFGIKTIVDILIFGNYFLKLDRAVVLLFVPLYELVFPIYSIVLMVLFLLYTPKWKGRDIYKRE